MTRSRPRSHLALPAVLVAVACVAACGTTLRSHDSKTSAIQPPREAQLLYVWRNLEETGIPEEMTIYADGEVRYTATCFIRSTPSGSSATALRQAA
jgi:hypothetical protein